MPHPIFIMFIGGIIALIGGFIGYWGKLQYDLKQKESSELRDIKIGKIDSTTLKTNEISQLIDKNVTLLKEQNNKIEEFSKIIDKNLLNVKEINTLQSIEINKQKFPFPEKLYLTMVLNFKFSSNIDYSDLFKIHPHFKENLNFDISLHIKEYENAFIKTVEKLGILQIIGHPESNTGISFNFNAINPIKFGNNRKINLNDLTDFYGPKNDNLNIGSLIYSSSNNSYYLKISKFPILFYKEPKLTSILDLDNLDFEISLNFIPTVPYTNEIPYIQLIDNNILRQEIYINTDNSNIGKLENVKVIENSQNKNVLRGKIKLTVK